MNYSHSLSPSSLELFTITLAKGTILYKGFNDPSHKFDPSSRNPCWFAFNKDHAKKYGGNVCVVKLSKKLVLINICSGLFKSHFTDMLNLLNDKDEREQALGAIGVPDLSTQESLVTLHVPTNARPTNICVRDNGLLAQTKYFNGHSRYSADNLDKVMLKHMSNVYGKNVDGYIQPVALPSCWHREFPQEVCVFDVSRCLLQPHVRGGGKKKRRERSTEFLPDRDFKPGEFVEANVTFMRKQGYPERDVQKYVRTREFPNYFIAKIT